MARLYLFGHRCLVRDALQALLQQAGQQVVGADADPDVADAELLAAPAELLLADLRWGTAPVQALLQRLAPRPQAPRCLLLMAERPGAGTAALRALNDTAVWHWLPGDVRQPALLAALASVMQGQRQPPPWRQGGGPAGPVLSALERQVLQATALGRSATATANELGLASRTVTLCRRDAMARLGLRDTVALARHALRQGWMDGLPLDPAA
jgi:DNA-binding NarL/FixJ family response regulator